MVWNESKGLCFYCGRPVDFYSKTLDHVIPRSKGGSNEPRNLVVSCGHCNRKKDSTIPSFDTIERANARKLIRPVRGTHNPTPGKLRRVVTIASKNPRSHLVIDINTGERLGGGACCDIGFLSLGSAEKWIREQDYRLLK